MGDVSTAGGVLLLILASCVTLQQNRRQKLFNKGALRFCGGVLRFRGGV